VIVHTVGGGHLDAVLAGLLAAALLAAIGSSSPIGARAVASTILLTLACLVKIVLVSVLLFWLWRLLRLAEPRARTRAAVTHAMVIAAVTAGLLAPFADGWRTFTALGTVGGLESWASPAHLVGHAVSAAVRSFAGAGAGIPANDVVFALFLFVFAALLVRLARRPVPMADGWGVAVLLLVLSLPFVLPWYACWFLPFVALLEDDRLGRIGMAASLVLALTLIPADPFHGFTTPGVFAFAHYVAAPVLLVLFALAARLAWSGRYPEGDGARDAAV
jgi:hypothetical protein